MMKNINWSIKYNAQFLFLLTFILILNLTRFTGVTNGAEQNEAADAGLGESAVSTTALVSAPMICSDLPSGASCVNKFTLCSGSATGGGCDCQYVKDQGSTIGPAPVSLSIPADCSGDLGTGATCASWQCICFNGTDVSANISNTSYLICLESD